MFHLGQGRVVAIGAAGRVGRAAQLRVTRSHQHGQKTANVDGVGCERVGQAGRQAAHGGLVEHMLHAITGALAIFEVANVAFHEGKARPLLGSHQSLHFIRVALVAGCKVV